MKILLVSDVECKALWDFWQPGRTGGAEIILSCGDLKAAYLEFLVTMENIPLYYVAGNHDVQYVSSPPEGCECLEDKLVVISGLRVLGLGGSIRYKPGPYQYTEREMARRIKKIMPQIRKAGGVDIVVAHAPVAGFGDAEDPAHKGFECFKDLIEKTNPKYFVHGHVHRNYGTVSRVLEYNGTKIVNAYERFVIEV